MHNFFLSKQLDVIINLHIVVYIHELESRACGRAFPRRYAQFVCKQHDINIFFSLKRDSRVTQNGTLLIFE